MIMMSNGNQRRKRGQRSASIELPPSRWRLAWNQLRSADVLLRIGVCVAACLAMWVIMQSWRPPMSYREGFTPPRNITVRDEFQKPDPEATAKARERARESEPNVYDQNAEPLRQLRAKLRATLVTLTSAATLEDVPPEIWKDFQPLTTDGATSTREAQEEEFEKFRGSLSGEENLARFDAALARAFSSFEQHGILEQLESLPHEDSQVYDRIYVQPVGEPERRQLFDVRPNVQIGPEAEPLKKALRAELDSEEAAQRVFDWVKHYLPTKTLTLNVEDTLRGRQAAADAVAEVQIIYQKGQTLAAADKPLTAEDLRLLSLEHQAFLSNLSWTEVLSRSLAVLGVLAGVCTAWIVYLWRRERALLNNFKRFSAIMFLMVAVLGAARWVSADPWRAELIPLLLFGLTIAIAYRQELAMLLATSLAAILVIAGPHGLGETLVLVGTVATNVLMLGRVRSRSKLVKIGVLSGGVALALTVAAGVLDVQPLGAALWSDALRNGLWAVIAGFLITGLLPFVERLFGVVTEISLLELGDVAHPLLQELVRRAPGTYNHSINVASIGEAAAESIGANGLLLRVGAYFHDIGKMLKPGYFVENQGESGNRHDSLVPAMSTLIIIAHIKDGANLARQHRLPQPIIDFIEQHHGTTLVEYFYHRANMLSESNPDAGEVEETAFRYPGPKPQTKEAGVLMLADAVESACRALVEPTPARIEGLIETIARKRLLDGQFDECGLTLEEVRVVQTSLVKSVTAVYHGRVKYPGQQTA